MKSPPPAALETDDAADGDASPRSILSIVALAFALTVGPAVLITIFTSSCFVRP